MDLRRLVNSDTSSQEQTESRPLSTATQHATQPPIGQSSYPGHDQRAYYVPDRQASFGKLPSGFENGSQPPTLTPITGQYLQHPSQSPVAYSQQQPSPYSARSGAGSRPSSHGQERYPATPIQLQPPGNILTQPHAISSTPSSQRSHTPHSVHHSPMPALQYGLPHPAPIQYQQPPSAGSFAPPPPPPISASRISQSHYDAQQSPQQHRSSLGPPPHRMSMDHLTESPTAQIGQSPGARRTSARSYTEREASVDVSPRSRPIPRPVLAGSRQSSLQQEPSAYEGGQAAEWNSHRHVNSTQYLQDLPTQHSSAQYNPITTHSRTSSVVQPLASSAVLQTNSINSAHDRPTVPRSSTMDMAHLLSDEPSKAVADKETFNSTKAKTSDVNGAASKKRALEEDVSSSRPAKKERTRPYLERPIWARLSQNNPRSTGAPLQKTVTPALKAMNGTGDARVPASPLPTVSALGSNQAVNFEKPWLNQLPYDLDFIQARQVLGPWEKSIRWNTPFPDLLRAVQDWLVVHLELYKDIAKNPNLGTIEIEAKIGQLVKPATGQRAGLPLMSMALLNPSVNRDYRFESELQEADFKVLNEFLNNTLVSSMQPGRVNMKYTHVTETDSFAHLSPAGQAMLPKSLDKQIAHGRELKLRTTTQNKTGKVTARIVKVPLADIHIYNPAGYDCRISMNAEINMMRKGLKYEDLITPATEAKPAPPSRGKDRLSYKHLAYQIDLTRVNVAGLAAKYEMEIEVDAQALRTQVQLMTDGKPHAFTDVVTGFLDNATFLMRQQKPAK